MRRRAASDIEYVVLAAGSARRMGFAKAVTPLAGASPLQRLAAACGDRRVTVVTSRALVPQCHEAMPKATVLVNDDAERGMSTSMLVAHASIRPEAVIAVLLADKPFVTAATLERCERAFLAEPCDVLAAAVRGELGHPVYFAPAARDFFARVPPGDSLRNVRDEPSLIRRATECDDAGVLDDLDTPDAWHAAERRLLELRHA